MKIQTFIIKQKHYENTNNHNSHLHIVNCFSCCFVQSSDDGGQKSKRNIQKQNKMSKKLISTEQIIKVVLIIALFAIALFCALI